MCAIFDMQIIFHAYNQRLILHRKMLLPATR